MTDPTLQIYIPAYMILAALLIILWQQFRKVRRVSEKSVDIGKRIEYNRLKRGSIYFWLTFFVFGVMTIVYSFAPEFYYVFLPLDMFHHQLINITGLLIMKIAIVWIVIAQILIDKELYKYSRNIESLSAKELVRYSHRMLLTGVLVLFVGFFVTITNIISTVLVGLCVVIYLKQIFTNPLRQFQI